MGRVVVLGAGLAGLSTSLFLRRAGVPHRVLERDGHVGGLARTLEEAGYRFDRTGHLLHLRDPEMRELVTSWFPPGRLLEIARKSVVYSHGVYTKYPFQAHVGGLPSDVAYACVRDFVKTITEPSGEAAPRTFEDFCIRHFGEAISRAFMVPYNEKLWGVHPREITAEWCDRFVPIPSLDQVLKGAFGVETPELGYNASFLYPRFGIGELVDALATRATPVETDTAAQSIDVSSREVVLASGERVPFDGLVSTLPLDRFVELLDGAPSHVKEAGRALVATRLQYLDVALNTPAEVDWHWAYVPAPEVPFYRVGVYSSFSASLAPAGKASLYVELAERGEIDFNSMLSRVADELVAMGVIRAREAIRFARLRTIDPAYVVFDHQRNEAVRTITQFTDEMGVELAGRYAKWTYASMEDALLDGRAAAKRAMDRATQ